MTAPAITEGAVAAVTTGNLVITLPTYATNDIVVITTMGWVPNTTTGTATQSLASPWTKYSPDITTITGGIIDGEYAFWWARATSSSSLGTTVTITRPTNWDTGANDTAWAGRAYTISGCITTGNPYDALTASAILTAANGSIPAITVNGGDRSVIAFLVVADNLSTGAAPSGWTIGTEVLDATGTDSGFQTFRVIGASSSTTSTATTVSAPAQGGYVFFGVSFRPPNPRYCLIT